MIKLFVILLLSALFLVGCGNKASPVNQQRVQEFAFMMDTLATVDIFFDSDGSQEQIENYRAIARASLDIGHRLEALFSMHIEGSDIWNINHAEGERVRVSDETIEVLKAAVAMSEQSGGAFDVTIGAVSALWDFSFGQENPALPCPEAHALAMQAVGAYIIIDGNYVQLGHVRAKIDLGGIGKGYAVDLISEFLMEFEVAAIVNFGGDSRAIGLKPDETRWTFGIQTGDGAGFPAIIAVYEMAVVSSGVDARSFVYDGRLYHHILDPSTGFPADTGIITLTIAAPTAFLAEGIITAVYVMGIEAGFALVETLEDVHSVAILADGSIVFTSEVQEAADAAVRLTIR